MGDGKAFDLVVIGGGPAGYVGAIRAAQLGMSVACVERDALGGVCLNWGCIPTKALLAVAERYRWAKDEAASWGVEIGEVAFNWSKVIERSRGVVGNLTKGVGGLLKKNKVAHIHGHAKIVGPGVVEIHSAPGKLAETLRARKIMIATGASPRPLPGGVGGEFDGQRVISAKEAMTLPERPDRLVIIGAGAIGMEMAYFFNAFGTDVTVVEMLDRILPSEDEDVSKAVAKAFRKQKIKMLTSTKTASLVLADNAVEVEVQPASGDGKGQSLKADQVLVAIGVTGRFDGLFDEGLGITVERGHIKVDRDGGTYETTLPGVHAVGDVIGPPWLAHVASEEAVACVERIAGQPAHPIDYTSIPGCTYCQPQIASLGMTEQACRDAGMKKGQDYDVASFPFQASGKAQASGHTEGFVKLIAGSKYGELLGAHMVGDNVTELIAELGLAKRLEATIDEVIATMHAHPTLSEAVHEAALGIAGRMVHF